MSTAFISNGVIQQNSPLKTTAPFTVGMWSSGTADMFLFTMPNSGGGTTWRLYWLLSSGFITGAFYDGSIDQAGAVAAGSGSGLWQFVIFRVIASTNRWVHSLRSDGTSNNAQNTSNDTATAVNRMCIGCWNGSGLFGTANGGRIGEFWFADVDIQPNGGAIEDAMLRQLAYYRPFFIQRLIPSIVEYHSFFEGPILPPGSNANFYQRGGIRPWTQSGSMRVGSHPPLLHAGYARPGRMQARSGDLRCR